MLHAVLASVNLAGVLTTGMLHGLLDSTRSNEASAPATH